MKKLFCVLPALLIAAVILIIVLGSHSVASSADTVRKPRKVYESIVIENRETLWSLAEHYADGLDMDKEEYVKTLQAMNGLQSDRIIRGTHLVIVRGE